MNCVLPRTYNKDRMPQLVAAGNFDVDYRHQTTAALATAKRLLFDMDTRSWLNDGAREENVHHALDAWLKETLYRRGYGLVAYYTERYGFALEAYHE